MNPGDSGDLTPYLHSIFSQLADKASASGRNITSVINNGKEKSNNELSPLDTEILEVSTSSFDKYLDMGKEWRSEQSPAALFQQDSQIFYHLTNLFLHYRSKSSRHYPLHKFIVTNELESPCLRSVISAGVTFLERGQGQKDRKSPALLMDALNSSIQGCIGYWSQNYRPYILTSKCRQGGIKRLEYWSQKACSIPLPDGSDNHFTLNGAKVIFAPDSRAAIIDASEAYLQFLINRLSFGDRKARAKFVSSNSTSMLRCYLE